MTTYPPYTLQRQDVSPCTSNTLATWPRTRPGAMARRALLRGLLWAAAARLSLHHAGAQRARAPARARRSGPRGCPRAEANAGAGWPWRWAPGPPTGPSRRPRQTRAAAAPPRVARPTWAPRPPPPPWSGAAARPGPGAVGGPRSPWPRGCGPSWPGWARGACGTSSCGSSAASTGCGASQPCAPVRCPASCPRANAGKRPPQRGGPPAPRHERQRHTVTGPPRPCKVRTKAPAPLTWRCAVTTRGDERGRHPRAALREAPGGLTPRVAVAARGVSPSFGPGVVFASGASGAPAHQPPHTGFAAVVHGRGGGVAPGVGMVACRRHGSAPPWGATPATALAALCPLAVVADDGSCHT